MSDAQATGCAPEARVAVRFLNSYAQHSKAVLANRASVSAQEWLRHEQAVTSTFLAAFDTLDAEGSRRDPELGWGVDLILDAQDQPDTGFEFHHCPEPPWIELRGKGWREFKVVVKVIKQNGRLKVDGAGRVNIPEAFRAAR